MAEEFKPRTPPKLKQLRDKLEAIVKEEAILLNQLKFLTKEIKRQKKIVKELKESNAKIQEIKEGFSENQVVSLPEYWQIRLLIPTNRKLLADAESKIKKSEAAAEDMDERLKQIRKDAKKINAEIGSWNRVIGFKK